MASSLDLPINMEDELIAMFPLIKHSRNVRKIEKWIRNCDVTIRLLSKALKKLNVSCGTKHCSLKSRIGRLESLRVLVQQQIKTGQGIENAPQRSRSSRVGWQDLESAFKGRIRTGRVINIQHIDPKQFLEDAEYLVIIRIKDVLKKHTCVKVNTSLNGEFMLKDKSDEKCFDTASKQLLLTTNLQNWYADHVVTPIITQMEEFQERDSGWVLIRLMNLEVNANRCEPLNGASFVELPRNIKTRRAVINVRSRDGACFAWAVVSALFPTTRHPDRPSSYPHFSTILNLTNISFPMTLEQIPKFEKMNTSSINVFILAKKHTESIQIEPLYITDDKKLIHINLLMIQNSKGESHFCWIKNLSRLLSTQLSKRNGRKFICDRCLHVFYSETRLTNHTIDCGKLNDCAVELPTEETKWLQFKNFNRKEFVPFIVYADFECFLNELSTDELRNKKSHAYQKHEAYSVGFYLHCSYDKSLSRYASYRGPHPARWFVMELKTIADKLKTTYGNPIKMTKLTRRENADYQNALNCHICGGLFTDTQQRVRDHCHFTGRYRGAAHGGCNLNYQDDRMIPIVFHNMTGYDAHFVITELMTAFEGQVSVLAINKEKYISFTKTVCGGVLSSFKLRFIDSFKFMNSSLDKLTSYLGVNELKILRNEFSDIDSTRFQLLTRKGVFPYDYLNSLDRLNDTTLPPREEFYSKLMDSDVLEEDYSHAMNVWKSFNIQTLGEYSDLYLKTDVLLLADVFENFRESCMRTYDLDPAYYYTLPGLTWDAMLKYTKIRLELLTDVDMLLYVERGIRGGLSQCSNRYGRANNSYMDSYDVNAPKKYLMYFDVNNLYGWAMCQYLPTGKFEWVADVSQFDVKLIPDDAPIGYILEVDLEYPEKLHDYHKDLPFCPTHTKAPKTKDVKLLATLHSKKRYIIHYRNLKQCLSHGLKLCKIYRILQFEQSAWLGSYIDLNTSMRTRAKNDFEKNLFKLMNNAVFGKTMENVRNHVDIKLISKWDGRYGAKSLIAKPNFHRITIFSENFVAIELRKLKVKFFKPIYLGMCILDLSKTCIYAFHYEYMKPQFQDECKLLYTDTDSLIYEINCDDIYEVIKRDIEIFDTSDYDLNNLYNIPLRNKKVPGLMKDENNGDVMSEFVGLRSKMYSIRIDKKEEEVKKAKGVKNCVVQREITFADYLECLNTNCELNKQQRFIRSKLHTVYSVCETKVALSSNDTKRYVIPNSTDTLPWGHYNIPITHQS